MWMFIWNICQQTGAFYAKNATTTKIMWERGVDGHISTRNSRFEERNEIAKALSYLLQTSVTLLANFAPPSLLQWQKYCQKRYRKDRICL